MHSSWKKSSVIKGLLRLSLKSFQRCLTVFIMNIYRRTCNQVKHLRWSFFPKIVNGTIFEKTPSQLLYRVQDTPLIYSKTTQLWFKLSLLKSSSKYFKPSNTDCMKSVQIQSFFWSVFSRIRTKYGDLLRNFSHSDRNYSLTVLKVNGDIHKVQFKTYFLQN